MINSNLRNGISVAIKVCTFLAAGLLVQGAKAQSASDSMTQSSLWVSSFNGLIMHEKPGRFESNMRMQISLPDGSHKELRVQKNELRHLGARLITAISDDGSVSLSMVTQNGAGFGAMQVEGTGYAFSSDVAARMSLKEENDLSLLPVKLAQQAVVSRSGLLQDKEASKVIAWIGPQFSNTWGLSSSVRAQYLVEKINSGRLENGLAPIELVASRPVDDIPGDQVFTATGISIAAADIIAVDEDLALAAAVLPSSRSVKTGVVATAFATIINPGTSEATSCGLVMNGTGPAGEFHFQQTDVANQPVGTQDEFVNIAGSAAQSFVFSFASSSEQSPGLDLPIDFTCANRQSATIISGLNTLWFSASDEDVPDIVAISETGSAVGLNRDAGIVDMIDRATDGAFVIASVNVGVSGEIAVSASSTAPAEYPVSLFVCQTDPLDGTCLASPAVETTLTIGANETPSFAVFANSDTVWPFDPAGHRVSVTFREGGEIRGSTSVALRTLQGTPDLPTALIDYEAILDGLPAHYTSGIIGQNPANLDNTPVENPVSNTGATLGRVLFYDKRLSRNNTVSCASCHEQSLGFSDPEVLSTGFEGGKTGRHSMGLANGMYYGRGRFFWDERADSLEDQVLMPIQDGVEMGLTLEALLPKLEAVDFYPGLFTEAFGDDAITSDRISKALAQFVRTLISTNSKFDQAYENGTVGNPDFIGTFTAQERQGQALFNSGRTDCSQCHETVAHVSDNVHNIGLDAITDDDEGAGNGRFKAPSLRNIAVRPPYMHDGRFGSLEEVVEFYNSGVQDHPNLSARLRDGNGQPRRINLTIAEKAAIVAFLETLTDDTFLSDSRYSDPFDKR